MLSYARSIVRLAAALALGAVLLAACGGGDDTDVAGMQETTTSAASVPDADVTVTAVDIDFPSTEFRARAGEITIAYVNEGRIRHTLVLEGVEGWQKLEVPTAGDVDSGTISLEPAQYTLFCDVPGHRAAGMEGTLTVE